MRPGNSGDVFLLFFNILGGIFCRVAGKNCRLRRCNGGVRQRSVQALGIAGIPEKTIAAGKMQLQRALTPILLMRIARIDESLRSKGCAGPISRPAIFAESSISTLSLFWTLSVAPPAFLNLRPIFF